VHRGLPGPTHRGTSRPHSCIIILIATVDAMGDSVWRAASPAIVGTVVLAQHKSACMSQTEKATSRRGDDVVVTAWDPKCFLSQALP
jgi:ABC-type proline/glycine betaine transport system substrate-binding protein